MPSVPLPASTDMQTVLKAIAVAFAVSLLVALLQSTIRHALWSVFNFIAAFFAFLSRALLTFAHFLSARIAESIEGLYQEGKFEEGKPKPWVGWLIIGPLVYFALMLIFMASDLTVALLVFEAMGLTLGVGSRLSVPLPLDGAMAVLFIALAVFWGIVLFDLLRLTPFAYIWSALEDVKRSRLVRIVLACLVITGATGLAMGIWSQAQLKGGLTEPWQTVLPWFVRGCIVALLIAATAISGKPLGSALTGVMVAVLLVVRAGTFCALVALKLVLVVLRQIMKIPLTLVAFVAFLGHSMWNWVAGFGWARRLRIGRLTVAPLPVLGGDADSPLVFRGADGAAAAQGAVDLADSNKALMRRIYQGVYPSPDAHLEEFFALDVITRDIASNAIVKGVEAVQESLQQLRSAFRDLDLEVNDQVAEGDSVVSRLTLRGTLRAPFAGIATMGERVGISAIDFVRLMEGKVVERWGLLNPSSLSRVETVPPRNGKSDHVVPSA